MKGVDHRIDLDPVTGGQHHRLGHQRRLQHLVDDLDLVGLVGRQLFQNGNRRTAVRNPKSRTLTAASPGLLPCFHQ
ncbi:glutamyl-tRNA reductase domain protein [Mycobacterium xenopi 4042]|uniref:Glutamyl-tRNA reductase domain protein n=1 Tax=Mycobacterium xenopi 4042 TaxID=1299334 RepID=X8DLW5_MYCXE|nr:glutamyl-tRNA reductase domain protein [Mycobacterium xenopi 4042]